MRKHLWISILESTHRDRDGNIGIKRGAFVMERNVSETIEIPNSPSSSSKTKEEKEEEEDRKLTSMSLVQIVL